MLQSVVGQRPNILGTKQLIGKSQHVEMKTILSAGRISIEKAGSHQGTQGTKHFHFRQTHLTYDFAKVDS
jgi:hypothetical protein